MPSFIIFIVCAVGIFKGITISPAFQNQTVSLKPEKKFICKINNQFKNEIINLLKDFDSSQKKPDDIKDLEKKIFDVVFLGLLKAHAKTDLINNNLHSYCSFDFKNYDLVNIERFAQEYTSNIINSWRCNKEN